MARTARPESEQGVITRTARKLQPPKLYKVLLHNDDYTTREFVVDVLRAVFHKNMEDAVRIMLHVHHNGLGICGSYPHEIAEAKVAQVETLARRNEFPLKCTMEEE